MQTAVASCRSYIGVGVQMRLNFKKLFWSRSRRQKRLRTPKVSRRGEWRRYAPLQPSMELGVSRAFGRILGVFNLEMYLRVREFSWNWIVFESVSVTATLRAVLPQKVARFCSCANRTSLPMYAVYFTDTFEHTLPTFRNSSLKHQWSVSFCKITKLILPEIY